MEKKTRNVANHYNWGGACDGWHLVKRDDVSIIAEKMPPGTTEQMHYHTKARQFFYILSGVATMIFTDEKIVLSDNEGIEIVPGSAHQMANNSEEDVDFLVISIPKSHGDKIIVSKDEKMRIIEYQKKYRKDFIDLNTEWLEKFYTVEPFDQDMMDRVDELIAEGGMVYFAIKNEKVLATCMTIPLKENTWEMCKLAAVGQYTGTGAGSAVFKACMDYAIKHGAKKLALISCRALEPAIHIYEKFGFEEIPLDKEFWGAEKADIAMEYLVK